MIMPSFLKACLAASIGAIIVGCMESGTGAAADWNLSSENLFPFQNSTNWWRYSTTDGHILSISVLGDITDGQTTYFKVSFAEKDKDTTDNWFRRSSSGTEYSDSLAGNFSIFMPPTFPSKVGTFALSSKGMVSYAYSDSLLVKAKYRKKVMKLVFPNGDIRGFDEIDFADALGIVRMIDNSGHFPVVYALDSARVNGIIYR